MPLQYPDGDYGVTMKRTAWERLRHLPLFEGVAVHSEVDGVVFLGTPSWERLSRIESAVRLRLSVARMRGAPIDTDTAFDELADIASRPGG